MQWPHSPVRYFGNETTFFLTAGTYKKELLYKSGAALDERQALLFANATKHACELQAWCLLPNHYHLVLRGQNVRAFISRLHTEAAIALNARDGTKGRRVWYQYWDKTLTIETSWIARLRYTHENAVHHGLTRVATQYQWCSARWLAETAPGSFVRTVTTFGIDRVRVYDPY